VPLVLVDVDHVRRCELACSALDRYLELTLGQEGEVVKLMRMPHLDVASFGKVHHSAKQVGYAAKVNGGLIHKTSVGIVPVAGVGLLGVGVGVGGKYSAIGPYFPATRSAKIACPCASVSIALAVNGSASSPN